MVTSRARVKIDFTTRPSYNVNKKVFQTHISIIYYMQTTFQTTTIHHQTSQVLQPNLSSAVAHSSISLPLLSFPIDPSSHTHTLASSSAAASKHANHPSTDSYPRTYYPARVWNKSHVEQYKNEANPGLDGVPSLFLLFLDALLLLRC
jgi:hypothetical protein